ncbi:MAG: D-alanyl-D-alanine carboxypeptidase [Hyphomicrobiaceae bacterium]|nr:D-alanyl-D-alanine carboxypeptidase [Hyphomicrobiaceae bacterium]
MMKNLVSGLVALSFALAFSSSVRANPKYAAIVIDGNTGKVLHSKYADAPRFPASLTKIMTLYVLFDYLKKDRLSTNTKFYVTPHSAAQPPTKLGLKPGSYIKVSDIIGSLVTKSANDAAATVAENIAGSEAKFARLMTSKARAIGMSNTVFKNASGLPNRKQVTTARDMAKLSVRIMNDFPQLSKAFKIRRFKYRGRGYRNHNGLLYSYKGTEGIKTGYTRASGFNLTSSVKRGRKHLIAVVMGGRSARSRNAEMRRLLNRNFPRAVSTRKLPVHQRMAALDPRRAKAPMRKIVVAGSSTSWNNRNTQKPKIIKASLSSQALGVGKYFGRKGSEGFDIQVGAYQDRNIAVGKLAALQTKASNVLNGHEPYIMHFEKNGVNYHRARFSGFSSRSGASIACDRLKRTHKMACIVMAP